MIKREKTRKNPKKMAARFARRQRGGGGSEALGRGVGGVVPPPPLLAMPGNEQDQDSQDCHHCVQHYQ